jgi:hypothetical protein
LLLVCAFSAADDRRFQGARDDLLPRNTDLNSGQLGFTGEQGQLPTRPESLTNPMEIQSLDISLGRLTGSHMIPYECIYIEVVKGRLGAPCSLTLRTLFEDACRHHGAKHFNR